jgi:hypothetical protein
MTSRSRFAQKLKVGTEVAMTVPAGLPAVAATSSPTLTTNTRPVAVPA